MFGKVLIANRGEIAIRVARTLKEMGIGSVAVYSEIDREAPHVREADEAFLIGPAVPAESYLNIEKIIATAREAGAEAIHPGYGFLAENADFARACGEAGIVFIGPPAEAIEEMGSKTRAREIMKAAGVPIVPGATVPAKDVAEAREQADEAGYPVACKAAGGGGGKGFRVAMTPDDLEEAFDGAAREGEKFFSDDRVYVERYLEDPRHVEVQVLADSQGNVIHLGERDCSIQRRHQKVIEEAPGPRVDAEMRERIGKIATDAAAAVGYRGAGTVEGMQVGEEYFFLEMNTRVQVEHCVTEMISGIDIVREQVLVAAGEPLSIAQEDVELRGHAIECRINAEAAHKNFAPAPGAISSYREPAGPGVRVDSGVEAGGEVTPMYDPMVAKLIVWDVDREHATRRMLRALGEYEIGDLTTLIPFHKAILATEQWNRGETCRDLMEDRDWLKSTAPEQVAAPEVEEGAELVSRDYKVEVSGKLFDVKVIGEAGAGGAAPAAGGKKPPKRERKAGGGAGASSTALPSPLQGTVFKVAVEQGAEVAEGDLICVIEAMKMENEITAHRAGKVASLNVKEGDAVGSGDTLAVIE
ncbi:MAG TPA: acetyl-CoA carboxylase biotin carboxylase subunit [Solirubrobacterales bacterium]|jgi:acetyl-CoA/propionyl-CoA carboxylase biotin carboxyl carrier protein|nr:acetyl-CoA carboxylase biotin carboxylase subunit [Solirubrobacterales bacterium]